MKSLRLLIPIFSIFFLISGIVQAEQWYSETDLKYKRNSPMLFKKFSIANKLIDQYSTEKRETNLEVPWKILVEIIEEDSNFAPAYVQLARISAKKGISRSKRGLDYISHFLDKSLSIEPKFAEAHTYYASVYNIRKDFKLMRFHLEKAESIGTNSPWLDINFGRLFMREGHPEKAIKLFEKTILRTDISNRTKYYPNAELKNYYKSISNSKRALSYADEITKLDPSSAYSWGNAAMILLYDMGEVDKAIKYLIKARKLYSYKMANRALAVAYYSKWAELKSKAPQLANEYYQKGYELQSNIRRITDEITPHPVLAKTLVALGEKHNIKVAPMTYFQPENYKGIKANKSEKGKNN